MTEKRFTLKYINEQHISANLYDNKTFIGAIGMGEELIVELLNDLSDEHERLKQELAIYRKLANCSNCKYQNYDWFEDGDEFEICEKGNNNQQIEYHICKDWREFF